MTLWSPFRSIAMSFLQDATSTPVAHSCPHPVTGALESYNPILDPEYKELLDLAEGYYASDNYLLAIFFATRAISKDPHPADAYSVRAASLQGLGHQKQAFEDYERAIEVTLDEYKYAHYFNRGSAYQWLEDYESAFLDYNQAIALNPQYGWAYLARGAMSAYLGNDEQAIADFEYAYSLDPYCETDYVLWGNHFAILEDFGEALIYYRQAITEDPSNPEPFIRLGILFQSLELYEQALQVLSDALALAPNDSTIYLELGNTYSSLERYQEALDAYQRYQQLSGDYETASILTRIQQIQRILDSDR